MMIMMVIAPAMAVIGMQMLLAKMRMKLITARCDAHHG